MDQDAVRGVPEEIVTIERVVGYLSRQRRKGGTAYAYVCQQCKQLSYRGDMNLSKGRFCSHACHSDWLWASKWRERGYRGWRSPQGYIRQKIDGKCFLQHRLVMEQHLGRKLPEHEEVHHRNGDKSDNRISNSMVVSHTSHWHDVACPRCEFSFKVK